MSWLSQSVGLSGFGRAFRTLRVGCKITKSLGTDKEKCKNIRREREKRLSLHRQTSSLTIRVSFPRGQAVNVTTHLRQSRIFETRLFYLRKLFIIIFRKPLL